MLSTLPPSSYYGLPGHLRIIVKVLVFSSTTFGIITYIYIPTLLPGTILVTYKSGWKFENEGHVIIRKFFTLTMHEYVTALLFLTSLSVISSSGPVRVTDLRVPTTAILGDSVTLICIYDLGTEDLYVVKWYKDDLEFYRYEPKDDNQSVYFPQPGIDIDLARSGSNTVFLRSVELDSAGAYKCQVSTDAPSYSCVQAVKQMNVVILPTDGPTITGIKGTYQYGDNVTLKCISAKSKPAAKLNWLVNGIQLKEDDVLDRRLTILSDNLEISSIFLRLNLTRKLFRKRKVIIECKASLFGVQPVIQKEVAVLGFQIFSHLEIQANYEDLC
ncbi:endothelial cell-selective adhesion molecule-like isoform X2 [Stegodyphus dumicola]|uniref:endothelial cell-selective adhesion molecule-like isoform X2 n=1 Tax=Stegodyphus dumicola TaxID=202533 RepID=UPI0015AC825D|nr:endothelial cell-selective adhesion molecule-like isoform X2 [Stegodyphus dumicola]